MSLDCYREFYKPFMIEIMRWIHEHTPWKTMNHTCGAVYDFIPDFIETGLDILNPIQISAAKMDPHTIKENYGDRLVFCGGTVDPQSTMDRGTAQEVYDQAIENLKILSKGGGMIAAHIHNIQATTRAENIKALFDAFNEFKIE